MLGLTGKLYKNLSGLHRRLEDQHTSMYKALGKMKVVYIVRHPYHPKSTIKFPFIY